MLALTVSLMTINCYDSDATSEKKDDEKIEIHIYDSNLKVERIAGGFSFPTSIDFLAPNDFLLLEKNTGSVKRITNGQEISKPLLQTDVGKKSERGMLGIAIDKIEDSKYGPTTMDGNYNTNTSDITHNVFLHYIECKTKGEDCENRVYRYELNNKNNTLINPKLLLAIPSFPEASNVGGIVKIGPDDNLYLTTGSFQDSSTKAEYKNKVQNFADGKEPDGRSGILRITQEGNPVDVDGIIGNVYPLNLYYSYGIKNSLGIDFDPVTGKLWNSEHGPKFGDEINLVEPGLNSGGDKIFGVWKSDEKGEKIAEKKSEKLEGQTNSGIAYTVNQADINELVYLGKAFYDEPEFTWDKTVSPTAITFLTSGKLGNQYENDLFVGSIEDGRIFHFDLNKDRTHLLLDGKLLDKIASDKSEYKNITFAEGFPHVTDLKVSPEDGYLYVVSGLKSGDNEGGAIFRILPVSETNTQNTTKN